jgi:tetratricopeptide (TPR) repeat protein
LERAKELDSSGNVGAEMEFKKAVAARDGDYAKALEAYGWFLCKQERFAEAASLISSYLEQPLVENRSNYSMVLSDLRRAAYLKARLAKSDKPPLAEIIEFAQLVSRYSRRMYKAARPQAERAVRLYPNESEAHLLMATVSNALGKSDLSCRHVHKAIRLGASSARAQYLLGNCHLLAHNNEGAISAFLKALDLSNGKLVEAWQALGFALAAVGRNKEALDAFRHYLDSGQSFLPGRELVERNVKQLRLAGPRRGQA